MKNKGEKRKKAIKISIVESVVVGVDLNIY